MPKSENPRGKYSTKAHFTELLHICYQDQENSITYYILYSLNTSKYS